MKLYRILCDKKEFVVANQLLRSGTSIGANIREALEGASKAELLEALKIYILALLNLEQVDF